MNAWKVNNAVCGPVEIEAAEVATFLPQSGGGMGLAENRRVTGLVADRENVGIEPQLELFFGHGPRKSFTSPPFGMRIQFVVAGLKRTANSLLLAEGRSGGTPCPDRLA
jgi:hypothetical protein